MRELSLHILDVAENSARAGATLVEVEIEEDKAADSLLIRVRDNGRGFDPLDKMQRNTFATSKEGSKAGLGIPLFRQAAEGCDGSFAIESAPGEGAMLEARFRLSHIDLMPMGDLGATLSAMVGGSPGADFVLIFRRGADVFEMDTRRLREQLNGVPLNSPRVLTYIKEKVNEGTWRSYGRQ